MDQKVWRQNIKQGADVDQRKESVALAFEGRPGLEVNAAIVVGLADLGTQMMDSTVFTMQGHGRFLPVKAEMQVVATDTRKQQRSAKQNN